MVLQIVKLETVLWSQKGFGTRLKVGGGGESGARCVQVRIIKQVMGSLLLTFHSYDSLL